MTDNTLWLVGGEQRGTLYSVYEFLEAYLGCRFYTETLEKIPETNTIFIDAKTPEDKQIPAFYYRETYGSSDASFVSKLRLNGTINTPDVNYGDRIHGSRNHNLFNLIDPDIYYEEHPEYFSGPGYTQPCLTNPEVIQIVIESCRKYLTEK